MSLNIKNDAVHKLARKLAKLTGTSMTAAIQAALEDRVARLEHEHTRQVEEKIRRVNAILDNLPPSPKGASSDHSDLYDEFGLPK